MLRSARPVFSYPRWLLQTLTIILASEFLSYTCILFHFITTERRESHRGIRFCEMLTESLPPNNWVSEAIGEERLPKIQGTLEYHLGEPPLSRASPGLDSWRRCVNTCLSQYYGIQVRILCEIELYYFKTWLDKFYFHQKQLYFLWSNNVCFLFLFLCRESLLFIMKI